MRLLVRLAKRAPVGPLSSRLRVFGGDVLGPMFSAPTGDLCLYHQVCVERLPAHVRLL